MTGSPSVLVLGAGSIGSRHVRNLLAAGADVAVADPLSTRAGALAAYGARPIAVDESWRRRWDGIVVASPTTAHGEHALAALEMTDHVLVEKPLAASIAQASDLAARGRDRLAVGFNLRFHEPVERLAGLVHGGYVGAIRSARLWFGSWLPTWRPAVDYRETYSARRDLGGGVLMDAIHELDLALWLVGELRPVGALVARLGPLAIDVEDTAFALLATTDGAPVSIGLDYLSRRYRRGIEVVADTATVRLDWARRVIEVENADGVRVEPADTDVALSYQRQTEAFLAWVSGGPPLPVSASEGMRSVALAESIRAIGAADA